MEQWLIKERYIAVDIECDGPIPGPFSMLSLGAVEVSNPDNNIYLEFKPISYSYDPEAMKVNGLDRCKLIAEGLHPLEGMERYYDWVDRFRKDGLKPVQMCSPISFDGMFIHWYFINFLGSSPFSVTGSGIDLRSYWMGKTNCEWRQSGKRNIIKKLKLNPPPHTHNALDDAKEQAHIFNAILSMKDE